MKQKRFVIFTILASLLTTASCGKIDIPQDTHVSTQKIKETIDKDSVKFLDLSDVAIENFDSLKEYELLEVLKLPNQAPSDKNALPQLKLWLKARPANAPYLIVLYNSFSHFADFHPLLDTFPNGRLIDEISPCELVRMAAYNQGLITFKDLNECRRTNTYPVYNGESKEEAEDIMKVLLLCPSIH